MQNELRISSNTQKCPINSEAKTVLTPSIQQVTNLKATPTD